MVIAGPISDLCCEAITNLLLVKFGYEGDPREWLTSRGDLTDIKVTRMGGLNNKTLYNPNAPVTDPVPATPTLPLVDLYDNEGELVVDNRGVTVQYEV